MPSKHSYPCSQINRVSNGWSEYHNPFSWSYMGFRIINSLPDPEWSTWTAVLAAIQLEPLDWSLMGFGLMVWKWVFPHRPGEGLYRFLQRCNSSWIPWFLPPSLPPSLPCFLPLCFFHSLPSLPSSSCTVEWAPDTISPAPDAVGQAWTRTPYRQTECQKPDRMPEKISDRMPPWGSLKLKLFFWSL